MAKRKGLSAPVPRPRVAEADGLLRRAAVSAAVPEERAQLYLSGAGERWPLTGMRLLVGRAGGGVGADIELDDTSVSRNHAELVNTPEGWQFRDLGSINGSFVDGQTALPGGSHLVCVGAVLRLGSVEVCVVSNPIDTSR